MNVKVRVAGGALMLLSSACGSSEKAPETDGVLLGRVEEICRTDQSGGEAWDVRIKQVFVDVADNNGSGDIDSLAELQTVPCTVWRRMDEGVQADQGSAFMTIYGFHPRLIWVGSAIGINEALRDLATAQLTGCGLDAGMD